MPASVMSPVFIIGMIRVGSVEGASCINLGNNFPSDFQSHKKLNQGFGSVSGDRNQFQHMRAALNDADVLDMFNAAPDEMPGWLKDAMEN